MINRLYSKRAMNVVNFIDKFDEIRRMFGHKKTVESLRHCRRKDSDTVVTLKWLETVYSIFLIKP